MGPWRPTANGTLIYNDYTWSTLVNMVYIEQPIGVGFSYEDGEIADPEPGSVDLGDYHAVMDMVRAMGEFFRIHPKRLSPRNKLYIASESYGGHYMPELVLAIFDSPRLGLTLPWRAQFSGMLVGNPYTSFVSSEVTMVHTAWGFQLIPRPLWYVCICIYVMIYVCMMCV